MNKKPPTKRNKENTKQNLLLSAKELFIKAGIPNTTIEQISTNAGYTRGAFYSTFKTKDELVLALMEQEFTDVINLYSQNLLSTAINDYSKRIQADEVLENILSKIPLNINFHILRTEFYLHAIRTPECTQAYKDAMRYLKLALSQILIEYLDKNKLSPTVAISDIVDIVIGILNIAMHNMTVATNEEEVKSHLAKSMFPRILKATTKDVIE